MNIEPLPDSGQNNPGLEPSQSTSAPPPADMPPGPPQAEVTPATPPKPKRLSPAEIAASIAQMDDATLEQAVNEVMSEATPADVSHAAAEPPKADEPATGSLVTGRIANIGSKDVLIDLGLKSFGAMALAEFANGEKYAVGDSIEVLIVGQDPRSGLLEVSRRKARQAAVLNNLKVGLVVKAHVTGMNKGGLEVNIDGLRGFIPASQVDLRFRKDISELIGQQFNAEVTKFDFDGETPNIVLSRRNCLVREEAEFKERFFAELDVGQIRRGKVRSVTEYGAFVDLGGVDGLLHIRDMSWGHVTKAEDVVKPGDEIDVAIVKIARDTKKLSLSLKQTITNPWETAGQRYTPGSRLQGRVARMANFGAFIELEPGVDGLLPISEMSWTRRVRHPSEVLKEGDVVEVSILSVDGENKRISLSLKALSEDPWMLAAQNYAVGSTVQGKVVRTTEFGAFVQLEDGIDGLVHISEISDERIRSVTDKVKPGDEVEVRVLGVDTEAKKISLSLRKPPAEPSPEEIAAARAERAAAEKKKTSRPKRGGITFGWDQGLGSLDPSRFVQP